MLSLCANAQVNVSGRHYSLTNITRIDAVYLFADLAASDAYLSYAGAGTPSWRDEYGTEVSNDVTLYPEDGALYTLYEDGRKLVSCYVIDYSKRRPTLTELMAEPSCDETMLTLRGNVPEMAYVDTFGGKHVLPREATIRYTSLGWGGEQWLDSVAVETRQVICQGETELSVGAPLRNTEFTLSMDQYAALLGMEADSVVSDEMEAWAVSSHLMSVTAKRGESVENEPGRPIAEDQLSGSAPLEVQFSANANTPTALYYRWEIYRGTNLIATRTDAEQRYTFNENGSYRVLLWVSNDHCITDSSVVDVTVSESMLKVPNVFTPNGDGSNDEFRVVYRSLAEFHCWIYNRWGHLVYDWTDPAKGWDGNIGGRPAATGAYYYVIRAKGTDADKSGRYRKASAKKPAATGWYQLSGDINLLR